MNINTINSTGVMSRCMCYIGAMLVVALTVPAIAFTQTVDLKTAANFRVLAAAAVTIGTGTTVLGDVGCPTVTNNGIVNGDIWVTTLTGSGTQTGTNPVGTTVSNAHSDLAAAYNDAATRTGATPIASELGGTARTTGVYSATTFDITGTLTLNGNATDVFIFQASATLGTAASSQIILNGVLWNNVFWQVGSSATLGASSVFEGNILANTSIDVGDDVTLHGRLLAGAVTPTGEVTLGATDMALPVQATSFKAVAAYSTVTLSWQTRSEVDNAGFNVLRQDLPQGQAGTTSFRLISSYTSNDNLKGMGTSTIGRSYGFVDATVQSGMTYKYKIQSVSINGTTKDLSTLSVTVDVPKAYALYQNYPNPFNPSTTIQFDLKQASTVTLAIYNVLGQKLLEESYGTMNAGRYEKSMNMDRYSSGVYFYKIDVVGNDGQQFVSIKKLVLMK